jgi:hypothetical protein
LQQDLELPGAPLLEIAKKCRSIADGYAGQFLPDQRALGLTDLANAPYDDSAMP